MLIVSDKTNSLDFVLNRKNESNNSDIGNLVVELVLKFNRDYNSSEDEALFDSQLKAIINNTKSIPSVIASDDTGTRKCDEFEKLCLRVLNNKANNIIKNNRLLKKTDTIDKTFSRIGGYNSSVSDIVCNFDKDFWVECKLAPSTRAGQFTVSAENGRIKLGAFDVSILQSETEDSEDALVNFELLKVFKKNIRDRLQKLLDSSNGKSFTRLTRSDAKKLKVKNFGLKDDLEVTVVDEDQCEEFIKNHYNHKHVKFFMTGTLSNPVFVHIRNLKSAFSIKAVARFKKKSQ